MTWGERMGEFPPAAISVSMTGIGGCVCVCVCVCVCDMLGLRPECACWVEQE